MTSPITPESRAEAVTVKLVTSNAEGIERDRSAEAWEKRYYTWAALIASALRDAENAAVDRAAQRCEQFAINQTGTSPVTLYLEGRADAGNALAAHIRSLKTKEA